LNFRRKFTDPTKSVKNLKNEFFLIFQNFFNLI
jgi:hypothetical protein